MQNNPLHFTGVFLTPS